jgi:DNA gyrase/topoisomerase IV subunit A
MENVIEQPIDEVFAERYATFGAATVKSRAVPSVEDGLNPVTRKILYTFNLEGYSLKFRKAATYVGTCLGE